MKDRKPHIRNNSDTQAMTRGDQVVINRLRTSYCRATHAAIMNREPTPECPFCGGPLTIDHILSQCKETKEEMTRMNITKEVWTEKRPEMEKLIEYVKKIGLTYITEYNSNDDEMKFK
jgi:hypothetical protein